MSNQVGCLAKVVNADRIYINLSRKKAAPGFEPGMEILQTSALPLGYAATTAIY
ncbi:hypothetical protein NIES39_K03100 [Arthrospira platensis NIES-39]|nr:hypothetical protein NIES39_K03100 [Arthrospira platensis NIES-39]